MILALLRAQWLSMRGFRLASGRRNAIITVVIGAIWYGFWAMIAWSLFAFCSAPALHDTIVEVLPARMILIVLYWQLAPLISASLGSSLDFRKLLAYPIPHRTLFAVEILLRLTTCVEMLIVVAGIWAGLAINRSFGGAAAIPRVTVALALFVAFNVVLSAGLRSVIERLLSHKRLREVLVFLMVMVFGIPRLLVTYGGGVKKYAGILSAVDSVFYPWAAAGQAALGVNLIGLAILLIWIALALVFSSWQFERNLKFDAVAAQATVIRKDRGPGVMERLYRLPGTFLPDPVAAIVEKELRALVRTPRFRLVFIMGFSFGILVWMPLGFGGKHQTGGRLSQNFLIVVGLYALTLLGQVSYWNAFGFDRSAAQVWFAFPPSIGTALVGKNIAAAFFILMEMSAVIVASLLLRVPLPGSKIVEAYVVIPIAALYLLAIGNMSSVHYPRAMNPERMSQGGASNRLQGLVYIFFPLALVPIFLAYLARYAFSSELAFWGTLGIAAVIGGVVYWISMDSAVAAAEERRETILAELGRGDGPVITE